MSERIADLPLFPLHTVLFPGGRLPLKLFEQRYLEMAKECLRENAPFGVCLILQGREVGEPALPALVGCTARIATWDMPQFGVLNVRALGERRFRIVDHRTEKGGLTRADIELLVEEEDAAPPARLSLAVELLRRVLENESDAQVIAELVEAPYLYESCAWVSARLAELLPLPLSMKQELLEMDSGLARLEMLHDALVRGGAGG